MAKRCLSQLSRSRTPRADLLNLKEETARENKSCAIKPRGAALRIRADQIHLRLDDWDGWGDASPGAAAPVSA
eukprot:4650960-Pyramimonas_sp.AAC.1